MGKKAIQLLSPEVIMNCKLLSNIIEEEYAINMNTLQGRSRKHINVATRAMCYFLVYTINGFKLADIGAFFDRDHSTVLYGLTTHQQLFLTDHRDYRRRFKHIETIYKVKLAEKDPGNSDSVMKQIVEIEQMVQKLEKMKNFLLKWCVNNNELPL